MNIHPGSNFRMHGHEWHPMIVGANERLYLAEGLPTLIVWGEGDPLLPVRHARAAHERMPGSRLEIFAEAGHFPHRDDPERFARVLGEFIRTTRPLSSNTGTSSRVSSIRATSVVPPPMSNTSTFCTHDRSPRTRQRCI